MNQHKISRGECPCAKCVHRPLPDARTIQPTPGCCCLCRQRVKKLFRATPYPMCPDCSERCMSPAFSTFLEQLFQLRLAYVKEHVKHEEFCEKGNHVCSCGSEECLLCQTGGIICDCHASEQLSRRTSGTTCETCQITCYCRTCCQCVKGCPCVEGSTCDY